MTLTSRSRCPSENAWTPGSGYVGSPAARDCTVGRVWRAHFAEGRTIKVLASEGGGTTVRAGAFVSETGS